MISVKILSKHVEKFVLDNAPSILTGVGAVSAVGAVFLTGKATFKAAYLIDKEQLRIEQMTPGPEVPAITTKEKVLVVWKEYIPAAGLLTLSVTSVVFSNRVSTKRAAALAAAYTLSEKAYGEYREKVVEKFNANKERLIRDEIAQDQVTKNPPRETQVIITGNGDVMCLDQPTGRYFKSNMEKLRSVQNDINAQVNEIGQATLSDFYVALGLTTTPFSEEIGWTTAKLFELQFHAVLTDDNQPCIAINYSADPIRGVNQFRGCEEDPPF